jgi:hypothetical protein
MPKPKCEIPVADQPHLVGVEATLRERPGVMLLALLTDEAGALMIRETGKVPTYMRRQAAKALAWCATDYRGLVTGGRTCVSSTKNTSAAPSMRSGIGSRKRKAARRS